jgi:hypothetical protein
MCRIVTSHGSMERASLRREGPQDFGALRCRMLRHEVLRRQSEAPAVSALPVKQMDKLRRDVFAFGSL